MITPVTVAVPASVANLGPGFDCLALAVEWRNEIRVTPAPSLEVVVEGEGHESIPLGPDNLVVVAMTRVLGAIPRARIRLVNRIPARRGLGSSAAAIVGGLIAARAVGGFAGTAGVLDDAIDLEGHADNVSACLLGGITVSLPGAPTARLDAPHGLGIVLAVAPRPLATEEARRALPDTVPFAEAVTAVARAASLTAALATGGDGTLLAATEDTLHQPARFALAPDTGSLVGELREAGFAAFLSGAGPSVAVLVREEAAGEAVAMAERVAPAGWTIRASHIANTGADLVVGG